MSKTERLPLCNHFYGVVVHPFADPDDVVRIRRRGIRGLIKHFDFAVAKRRRQMYEWLHKDDKNTLKCVNHVKNNNHHNNNTVSFAPGVVRPWPLSATLPTISQEDLTYATVFRARSNRQRVSYRWELGNVRLWLMITLNEFLWRDWRRLLLRHCLPLHTRNVKFVHLAARVWQQQ